ncbi:hypothetical protein ABZT03_41530 [Streptomyces sp. NPDC005574]|uniref:hypothetical protein n=1 Tax=Streptomyces sp. NPDC005574 TaxID=3156891 RepID=UPI0033AA40B9
MSGFVRTEDPSGSGPSAPGPLQRLLRRSRRHRQADGAVTAAFVVADLLLVTAILLLGTEGVFTEDWLGYPGMMDPNGASYQRSCVLFLWRVEAVTVGVAVACRLWTAAVTQLVLLTAGAAFIGSLSTYWNP